jgi:hypothetical protein
MLPANRIVADGYWRARTALEPKIRDEVAAEYADRLEQATTWLRWRITREMEREITRRVHSQAPPDALY